LAQRRAQRQSGESGVEAIGAANGKGLPLCRAERSGRPKSLQNNVLVSRAVYEAATELMTRFGEHALVEAASRAETSRGLGNVIHFCHWRETERAIELLSGAWDSATVH
jgi:hypothetical protein